MPDVKCFNCGTFFGYEQGNKLNLGGRVLIKDSATFGCETCGTLQTWEAGRGNNRKSDEFERPASIMEADPVRPRQKGAKVTLPTV